MKPTNKASTNAADVPDRVKCGGRSIQNCGSQRTRVRKAKVGLGPELGAKRGAAIGGGGRGGIIQRRELLAVDHEALEGCHG